MKRAIKPLALGSLALSSELVSSTKQFTSIKPFSLIGPLSSSTAKATSETEKEQSFSPKSKRDALILEQFRQRHLKGSLKSNSESKSKQQQQSSPPKSTSTVVEKARESEQVGFENDKSGATKVVSSFQELGLKAEITGALSEIGIWVPSEIQSVGIPALLDGKSVVLSSDSGSGRTLAYLLPLIQGFQVAGCISHHAMLKSAMEGGSGKSRTSENFPNGSIGMLVATPSETIKYIEEGSVVPDDIKYLVLDEMDTMFNHGLGSEIHKILCLIKNRASKAKDFGVQTVLVTSTITKMLGNQLSPLMEHLEQNNSGKVAAMMLEMDQQEVFDLTQSLDDLKKKIAEAMDSLHLS
ncbi:DEAD-box ATP-dependent RNA helicase 39-like isoform X3 [Herrania umbratica]|uniref:DEAD-box ATP-dependent RNA helicase 39-like isoform X3 n=1 Tax=Herrania umbratica TaxID=108875 RepID=A0A6J1ACP8_9ROSI|nr:DEAD-box ATP-dependent RNA helicase 39-like isoform X3 [Herrania umbratica]